ncbi:MULTISPECIES: DUF7697 family protein [Methylorubrum]|uniref:Uncharacterized protein n=1 Tax=Methylorubrum extorquens (strain CM4 / NCIMB 13688) TaxID=440085 RepID=B7KYV7_METC4|nr:MULTISPECIES: hypothetical protein [Methylorubrum]ACK81230.1 hypothetical protein Mchl_0292 [Methylorubrum extorquens CM4]UGB26353.1 DUF1799 domain-containing protein [Methylorubrum sp. B1-46]
MAWAVIRRCGGQVRAAFAGPYALDYGAILMMADAMGAETALLADALPSVEPIIVKAYRENADDGD